VDKEEQAEDWPLTTICWYAIFVWFGASLFSQSVYMAKYGIPYDANIILDSMGIFAWIVIGIEIVVWVSLLVLVAFKCQTVFQISKRKQYLLIRFNHIIE